MTLSVIRSYRGRRPLLVDPIQTKRSPPPRRISLQKLAKKRIKESGWRQCDFVYLPLKRVNSIVQVAEGGRRRSVRSVTQ